MSRPDTYSQADIEWLRDNYGPLGPRRCAEHLGRTRRALYAKANQLGLHSKGEQRARTPLLAGDELEEAIKLREDENWSFARIGKRFGVCEAAATNAVLIALCPRKGHTPARRDAHGGLLPAEIDRMRLMLQMGIKAVDIQLRMGVSSACVAEQRRRYQADLAARERAPLPPYGNGERYSGVRVSKADRRRVEAMLLQGYGSTRTCRETGVSNTVCKSVRNDLVKRLARKGQSLPGCDIDGRRLHQLPGLRNVHPAQVEAMKVLLREGMAARRAANLTGIGHCSGYRIRDEVDAERAEQGLPPLERAGVNSTAERRAARAARWLKGPRDIVRFRALIIEHGYEAAIPAMKAEIEQRQIDARAAREAERIRPKSFEEQLARVRAGAKLAIRQPIRKADPAYTLGGVATGAL